MVRIQPYFVSIYFFLGGVYKSPEDYFHIVQSLWNAMTFGEGNAALSPRCRWRSQDGKECGQVLSLLKNIDIKLDSLLMNCININRFAFYPLWVANTCLQSY